MPVRSAISASLLPIQRKIVVGLGVYGECRLAVSLPVAKAGESEDELIELLLSGCRIH